MSRLKIGAGFRYHMDINVFIDGGGARRCEGLVVDCPEDLKCFELVLHRAINPDSGRFTVSELSTGLAVGYGQTRRAALADAFKRIRMNGVESTLKFIEKKRVA
jgi:hypothetical protein